MRFKVGLDKNLDGPASVNFGGYLYRLVRNLRTKRDAKKSQFFQSVMLAPLV